MSGKVYLAMVRRVQRTRGKARRTLRKRAAKYRKKLIGRGRGKRQVRRNRWHPADGAPKKKYGRLHGKMSHEYRALMKNVLKSGRGKQALKKYRMFWGLPWPTEVIQKEGPNLTLVGAGKTTGVYLSSCPGKPRQGERCRNWSIRGRRVIAFDPSGRRVFILAKGSQRRFGKSLKFVGYARYTEYIPTVGMERAGSFKAGKLWRHEHNDEGGRFPKVYRDAAGNFAYAPGTLRIGKWMRR